MLNKLLRDVVTITIGKQFEQIADLLNSTRYVNEFNIAKKMDITINQTRNLLYKISDFGLVSSERKKDKKKGWYTYFWRFEILKVLNFLKDLLIKERKEINLEINKREKSKHYICKLCNLEYDENEALFMDFTCDECGELFEVKEDTKLIRDLKKSIGRIDEKISIIDIEIIKEVSKINKKKALIFKKMEKEKEEKKAAKRKIAAAKRELAKKNNSKKKIVSSSTSPKLRNKGVKKKSVKKKVIKRKPVKKKITKKKPVKRKVVKKKVIKKKPVKRKPVKKKVTKRKSVKKK